MQYFFSVCHKIVTFRQKPAWKLAGVPKYEMHVMGRKSSILVEGTYAAGDAAFHSARMAAMRASVCSGVVAQEVQMRRTSVSPPVASQ